MIVFMLCWAIISICYYLILFHLPDLEGNLYLNGLSLALSELLGNLLIGLLIHSFGLRNTLLLSFTLLCLSAVLYLFPILTFDLWYASILFIMKLSLTGAVGATFFGTNAVFREDLVPIIFALCNLVARGLTMPMPYIAASYGDTTVMAVVFGMGVLGVLAAAFINEGKKKKRRGSGKRKKDRKNR
jgi:hypothetical protein